MTMTCFLCNQNRLNKRALTYDSFARGLSPEVRRQSKKISNDQEQIQSHPTSCPQNQKGNKLTAIYERHSR